MWRAPGAACTPAAVCQRYHSISLGSFSETVAAIKTEFTAIDPNRASHARNRFATFSIVASLVLVTCMAIYFRAEVASYVEADGVEAQAEAMSAKTAALLERTAITVEHSPGERDGGATFASELAMARRETEAAPSSNGNDEAAQLRQTAEAAAAELQQSLLQERDRVAALARELATARRDLETEVALSRKTGEEAERLRQAAKAAAAELEQERNRSAALARDHESAQRVIGARSTTERPTGSQNDAMKQVAEQAATEPPRTAVQRNPEAARLMARANALLAQGNIGAARVALERAAETGNAQATFALAETYDPNVLATWRTYGTRGDAAKARDLYARAYDGGIKAAKDRSHALVIGNGGRKPASLVWTRRDR